MMVSRRQVFTLGAGAATFAFLNAARAQNSAQTSGSVLVFGATGKTGSAFIRALPADVAVTAFVRPTSNRDALNGRNVTFVEGNALTADDVDRAFASGSFSTVFAALQSRPNEPSPYAGSGRNIAAAAKRAGVKQIIWIGQVGASYEPVNPADYPDINFAVFGKAMESMGQAERAIVDSGVPYTFIRVGAVISERGKPPHPPTGQGRLMTDVKKMGPIAYGDLGRLAAGCVGQASCLNRVFHATDDTLGAEYKHWRCRRFATPETIDAC